MAEYDFSTLGSSDFEKLVCDLLNASQSSENSITYKLFKDGKDKGIDFLYSTPNMQYNHVGQAKHYYRTGYKGLKTHLTDKEVSKVKALNPKKYILATSVDLTVNQTIELKQVFKPYIKDLSDIYGKKNINQLLDHHQDNFTKENY